MTDSEKEKVNAEIQAYLEEYFYGEYAPYDKVRAMALYFYELGQKSRQRKPIKF